MAVSLQTHDIYETPNSEILDDTTTEGPTLPAIADLNLLGASKVDLILDGWRSLFFIPNGVFFMPVRLHQHIEPSLAYPDSNASDIYLVTRPQFGRFPSGSLQHWSFYTQGVFYHLSAPNLPIESTEKSHNASKSREAVCELKCNDLRNVDSEDYVRLQGSSGRKPLLAYKVGQTDYRSDQVLRLAEWAVRQLSTYGIFSANCQHFALEMVRRTAMRMGDRSAFAGTAIQIADWDLQRGIQPHSNGIDRGFLVAPSLPGMLRSLLEKPLLPLLMLSLFKVDESLWHRFNSRCWRLFQC